MGLFDRLFRRSDPSAQAPEPAPEDEQSRDLVLRVSNLQGIGRREGQEDSFALLNASDPEALVRRGLFAVVCDGMGGMEGGREISEGAVDGFLQLFQALNDEGDVPRQLREGTCALSDGLFQRAAAPPPWPCGSFRTPSTGSAWGTAPYSCAGAGGCFSSTRSTPI